MTTRERRPDKLEAGLTPKEAVLAWMAEAHALAAGIRSESAPRDAPWGERYFHVRDPDGHELSFARPLAE